MKTRLYILWHTNFYASIYLNWEPLFYITVRALLSALYSFLFNSFDCELFLFHFFYILLIGWEPLLYIITIFHYSLSTEIVSISLYNFLSSSWFCDIQVQIIAARGTGEYWDSFISMLLWILWVVVYLWTRVFSKRVN